MNMHHSEWTAGLVSLFHRFDVHAFAWDAQEVRQLRAVLRMGIDAVYCDRPDRMVATVGEWDDRRAVSCALHERRSGDNGQMRTNTRPTISLFVIDAEHAGVLRIAAVVAHHPVVSPPGSSPARSRMVVRALREVRLLELLAVDEHVPAVRRRRSRPAGRSRASRGRRCPGSLSGRRLEHDDVAAVHRVQLVRELVDEHAVVDLERRHHRLGRDVERLEQERLDQQRDDERQDDEADPLERDAGRVPAARLRRVGRPAAGPVPSRRSVRRARSGLLGNGSTGSSSHARLRANGSGRRPGDVRG